jgi:hypothetical protein
MIPKEKRRNASIANALTRAVVRNKRITIFKNGNGKVDVWISGEYSGCLDEDVAESILVRD